MRDPVNEKAEDMSPMIRHRMMTAMIRKIMIYLLFRYISPEP